MITESGMSERICREEKHVNKLLSGGKTFEGMKAALECSKHELKAVEHYISELIAQIPPMNGIETKYFIVALKIVQRSIWELNKDISAEHLYEVASRILGDGIGLTKINIGDIGGHDEE